MKITVIDVSRAIGVEPVKEHTWAVGQIAVQKYRQHHGRLPVKDLRTMTCAVGVHSFALYPTDWWPVIEEAIRSVGGEWDRRETCSGEAHAHPPRGGRGSPRDAGLGLAPLPLRMQDWAAYALRRGRGRLIHGGQ